MQISNDRRQRFHCSAPESHCLNTIGFTGTELESLVTVPAAIRTNRRRLHCSAPESHFLQTIGFTGTQIESLNGSVVNSVQTRVQKKKQTN